MKIKWQIILVCMIIVVPIIFSEYRGASETLKVSFLDIGQGDSILIETPDRHLILVDGGPNDAILHALSKELSFWQRTFDLLILTNPDRDHFDGFLAVLDRYKVKRFLISGVWKENPFTKALLEKITEKKIPLLLANQEQDFLFDHDMMIDVLYPEQNLLGEKIKINEGSIVFMLRFGEHRLLFTGDAERGAEEWLITNIHDLYADILKVGHHGSKTSSSEDFLEKVKPMVAIISSGKNNRYGHPHEVVLDRLRKIGATILRTDQEGTITFQLDY